jgi:hypothetical protein
MAVDFRPPPYVFIIDTDTYAGNFERPLCAHITGQVGECGVGGEQAAKARLEIQEDVLAWFDDLVISMPDDHGCHRPASIWRSPDGPYNSVAIFLEAKPPDEIFDLMCERAHTYTPSHHQFDVIGNILAIRLIQLKLVEDQVCKRER